MSEDDSVRKEVWDGKIPVCFTVDDRELSASIKKTPEPCYMLVRRVTYFSMFYEKLEKLFAKETSAAVGDEMWLSSEEIPLKWHYPVGVLYDLYGNHLPWNITVHFKNFPEDEILHCQGNEPVKTYFVSKLKEADYLKHKLEVFKELTQEDTAQLWHGFLQDQYSEFWGVNKKFMLNSRSVSEPFKNIPFCIYREGQPVFQKLIASVVAQSAAADNNKEAEVQNQLQRQQTLEDLLRLYDSNLSFTQESGEHCPLVHFIHGIEVPLSVPLQWLSENMSYPDNFLHICIVPKTN
ncbi:hypothetical protein EMCRGX_G020081 [Ephydatia muelleri]|eukprot:Em0016g21a